MTDEKNQQEVMFKLAMYEQHINQLNQQLQAVENAINELNNLSFGIEELKGKKDNEIFAPVGRGIFVKAKLISEDLLVDVGGKNFVKKDVVNTRKMIKEQIERLENAKIELEKSLEEIGKEFEGLYC